MAPGHHSAAPHPRSTVLLVDDDPHVCEIIGAMLQRDGFEVLTALDGETALQLAASHPGPIDLLIVDVIMRGLSGPQLADRLRGTRRLARVLFISGLVGDSVIPQRRQPGVCFLAKPFDAQTLTQRVHELLQPLGT